MNGIEQTIHPVGSAILGIIIPAGIFLFSFGITYWLYRHFSKEIHKEDK
jgi:hypothetical protein